MHFLLELDNYRGPLDLLWYLVRKQELEISTISLARVTQQYLEYVSLLETIDVNVAGEFIDLASQLIEMKSRSALPQAEEEATTEELLPESSSGLVQQLLEYKKLREVASTLEDRARQWQLMYPRLAGYIPKRTFAPHEQPIREVELWDLVSALGRILREQEMQRESNIVYDEVPLQHYIQAIHQRLVEKGEVALTDILQGGMSKSAIIGLFLAVLELVRHHSVEAEQAEGELEIWVRPGANFSRTLELVSTDTPHATSES